MKPNLIQTGPNTWDVHYPEPRQPAAPARVPLKTPPRLRKRYGIADGVCGFRGGKRYLTAKAATQAAQAQSRVCGTPHFVTAR